MFNGMRTRNASIASPSISSVASIRCGGSPNSGVALKCPIHEVEIKTIFAEMTKKLRLKTGLQVHPSRLEIAAFIGVYSIFIGTSYLLVCSVICSCCWRSSRSGGAESCFSVVLSPICLSTWKIQGNIKGLYSGLTFNDFNVFERYPNIKT